MSLCAYCGHSISGPDAICLHHTMPERDDWASSNRVMCDFLHRGVVLPVPHDVLLDDLDMRVAA
jgi:hypothetical protein